MFKLLMKIVIGIVQIPLTILYFVLNFIGGLLAGVGWIIGVIIFAVIVICWLFGQFETCYQPLIGIAMAVVTVFAPAIITDWIGSAVLKLKTYTNGLFF